MNDQAMKGKQMDWNDFTTVHAWTDQKRNEGHKVDHKWFYNEVQNGTIPSVTIAGTTYVRKSFLDDAWPRYTAHVKEALGKKGRENGRRNKARFEEIINRLKNIEAILADMNRIP